MSTARPLMKSLAVCLGLGLVAGGAAFAAADNEVQISAQASDGDTARAQDSATAYDPDQNRYLTVWEGEVTLGGQSEIFGRLVGADGIPLGEPMRITTSEPDGDTQFEARMPAVAYNPTADEYLLVWTDTRPVVDGNASGPDFETYAMRLDADGLPTSEPVRLSEIGESEINFSTLDPAVAYNPTDNTYLVAWEGTAAVGDGLLPFDEIEIFAQRVDAAGAKIGENIRVSNMGPDGDTDYGALDVALAYNATDDEYLLGWRGDDNTGDLVANEFEIYAQRMDADGSLLGDRLRVSETGADGDANADASQPTIAHNPAANSYLVAWQGALLPNQAQDLRGYEISAQRLAADGAKVGVQRRVSETGAEEAEANAVAPSATYNSTDDEFLLAWRANGLPGGEREIFAQRIAANGDWGDVGRASNMGPDGDVTHTAGEASAAYNSTDNEYLISWTGRIMPTGESEIWGSRLPADGLPAPVDREPPTEPPVTPKPMVPTPTPPVSSAEIRCAAAEKVVGTGAKGTLSLTTRQLRINQRIGQAAVRRVTAIQNWLDEGIVGEDICGGSLTTNKLAADTAVLNNTLQTEPATARPRPLVIPKAKEKGDVTFTLTAGQLRTNQRVYLAALRRANALADRLDGKLTGGDITDGRLSPDRLLRSLALGTRVTGGPVKAPSTTEVAPAGNDSASDFTPTVRQMQINQRIAQAAIRRSNELRLRLEMGLVGDNFSDGSITAVDWSS